MIKRILSIENPCHLSSDLSQLVLTPKNGSSALRTPVEDLGFLVIDHPQVTLTKFLLQDLARNNVAVLFTDEYHLPASMLFQLTGHHLQNERFRKQLEASEPLQKQLWQQTIRAKIRNQAAALRHTSLNAEGMELAAPLMKMAEDVRSGDSDGREAKAARYYWPRIFGEEFRRERKGDPPNAHLNYGYAVVRAAVARAITAAGLLPTLGIHHRNKYNDFCLADDIMEPYRPFVDLQVWYMMNAIAGWENMGKEVKAALLSVLNTDCRMGADRSPLQVAMMRTAQSLAACFEGRSRKLVLPELIAG